MQNLILAFNVVLPLFLCIVLGYFLRAIGMIKEVTQKDLNRLCFKVFLPIYLFNSIYTTDLAVAFDGRLVMFAMCGLLRIFFPSGLPPRNHSRHTTARTLYVGTTKLMSREVGPMCASPQMEVATGRP